MGQDSSVTPNSSEENPIGKTNKIYLPSSTQETIRQGEIISEIVQVKLKLESIGVSEGYKGVDIIHPLAIIVTQDCDLEQDYNARFTGTSGKHRLLPNILFCEVELADQVRHGEKNQKLSEDKQARSKEINSDKWKLIKQNKDERFHFLRKIAPDDELLRQGTNDHLVVEFKRHFTIPTDEVYHRIKMGSAKRRCKLASPYLEHFSVRFHYFHFRVALPEDHDNE